MLDSARSLNRSLVTGICWFSIACSAFLPQWSVVETTIRSLNGRLPDSDRNESMSSL